MKPTRHSSLRRASLAVLGACALGLPLAGWASALDQFRSFVSSTKSASGEFTQRVMRADGKQASAAQTSSGSFQFARPGKFIWTYQKPYEQLLQADGQKLYIYDHDLNQVTIRKLGDALGSSPAAILFGSNDLEQNFSLKDGGSRDGLEWLQAIPKTRDTTFESIAIGLRDGVPAAMELRDAFGQQTLLNFTRFEKNPPLPDSRFKFTVPKGADVLEH